MKKVLVALAAGAEELEAVAVIDVLRRAGCAVTAAGIAGAGPVECSRRVRIVPDAKWVDVAPSDFDVLIIPGGMAGVEALMKFPALLETIRCFDAAGKMLAAICAGPLVLHAAGVLKGRRATCYPSCSARLTDAIFVGERVVRDGHIITSQGPGTALAFALFLAAALEGVEKADAVAAAMLVERRS